MRITVLTAGTRGDVQPYVALGVGLQRAGYQARIAAGEDFASFVRPYGLDYFPIRANFAAMMSSAQAQAALDAENPLQLLAAQMKASQNDSLFDRIQDDVYEACQDADAVLYAPGLPNGYFIARRLGIPCVALNVVPMTPTRTQPAALFYSGPRLGGAYNLLTHLVMEQGFWQAFRPTIQRFWRRKQERVAIPLMGPYRQQRAERTPILYGYSEGVLPRPADWPDYAHITGYWFLEEEPAWSPPASLISFLQSGPPPVYIGFGSMGSRRRARAMTQTLVKALEISGQRGLLATGWNGLDQEARLPHSVYMLESAPHSWLFPQVTTVVHHGGAGTTAAGLRAGVPAIIVPHAVDQPMWGQRIAELGIGPQPIPRRELTAERLARAITATSDPTMRERAAALGQRIRAEDGVAKAVEILDRILQR